MASQVTSPPPPRRLTPVNYTSRARWAMVKIETDTAIYVGRLHIPETKKRVSDVISDDRQFLSLTDVRVNDETDLEPFMAINKSIVRTLRVLQEGSGEQQQPQPS